MTFFLNMQNLIKKSNYKNKNKACSGKDISYFTKNHVNQVLSIVGLLQKQRWDVSC